MLTVSYDTDYVCVCVCVCAFVNGYLHCVSQYVLCACACVHACVCVCVCVHCAKDIYVHAHSCVLAVDTVLWPIYLCGSGTAFIDAFITSIPSKRHLQTCPLYFIPYSSPVLSIGLYILPAIIVYLKLCHFQTVLMSIRFHLIQSTIDFQMLPQEALIHLIATRCLRCMCPV